MNDADYMALALRLAEKGLGTTSPNPMVGAVIVKEGRIIGQGYHHRCGEPHAERLALAACTQSPAGATLYVTLEPCCHTGRQPPCADAILASGIRRVVVGSGDPNPMVAGKGVAILRAHGIDVTEGILRAECNRLNQVFFHYITTRRPYAVMKFAMSLDGKIAASTGASQWITGEDARRHVHQLRSRYRSILVGVGTVLADDPMLNCRLPGGNDPIRIICDTHLRTPLTARVVTTAREIPTILATCCPDPARRRSYEALGREEIDSVLIEGGGTLHWAALKCGIVQKVMAYIAPMLLGGQSAKTPVEGEGFHSPADAVTLKNSIVTQIGRDFLIESEVEPCVHRDR